MPKTTNSASLRDVRRGESHGSRFAVSTCLAASLLFASNASAQSEDEGVFTYAFRGLGIGAPVGAAAGYLLTRDDQWQSDDWKDLGMGVAIGAITGAVGGLAIGITDLSDGQMGMGATVLRDTWYGTLLGFTVGAIVGGVLVMDSGDAEDILGGMAWGAVIGAPVGIGVGFIEAGMRGQMGMANAPGYARLPATKSSVLKGSVSKGSLSSGPGLDFALVPVRAVAHPLHVAERPEVVWVPTLVGSF